MSALPNINVKRIELYNSGTSSSTNIDLIFSMFLRDFKTQDLSKSKSPLAIFYNSIKVLVVQITNEDDLNLISTDTEEYIKTLIKSSHPSEKKYITCSLRDGNIQRLSKSKTEVVYKSPQPFNVAASRLTYLAYAFIPFAGNRDNISMVGRPTIEEVIKANSVVTEAKVLLDPNGDIYTGSTHIHQNKIMAGPYHTSKPHPVLQERSVHNSTIHDLRMLESIKRTKLNTSLSKRKDFASSYISELFVSRDEENNCRFSFFLDFNKLAATLSKIPMLHSNTIASDSITKKSRINSIKILRRRFPGEKRNALFMPVVDKLSREKIEIIAATKDNEQGQLQPNTYFNIFGEELRKVGNLREIDLSSATNIRAFTGADIEMSEITDGVYQYGVEIQIEDAAENFAQQKMAELKSAYNIIEDYYRDSLKAGSYSVISEQFKKTFRREVRRHDIYQSVEKYIEILNLLRKNMSGPMYGEKEVLSIFSLICPINGTPRNIQLFKDLLGDLIVSLANLLQLQHNSLPNKSHRLSGDAPEKLKNDNIRASKKIIKWFDSDFNSNLGRNTGYYFFNPSTKTKDGHVTISDVDYNSLIEAQSNKLFGTSKALRVGRLAFNVDDTRNSYLSPISIGLGGKETEHLIQKDSQFYNIDKYNSIMSEMIRFNLNKSISGKDSKKQQTRNEKLTFYGQKLRNNLIDIFSSLSCTIESMPAFATPTSKIKLSQEVCKTQTTSVVDKDVNSKLTPVDKKVVKRQESPELPEESKINPNNILNRLSSALIMTKISSPKLFNIFDARDDNFYFSKSGEEIGLLPNQLKALIASYSGQAIDIDRNRLAGNHRDQFGFLYMNFMNIMKVEVLTGFAQGDLSQPTFQLLTQNNLKKGSNLCRLTRYSSLSKNLPDMKIEYPVYYEYFVLENSSAGSVSVSALSNTSRRRQQRAIQQESARSSKKILQDITSKLAMMTESANMNTLTMSPRSLISAPPTRRNVTTAGRTTPATTGRSMPGRGTTGGGSY